MATPYNGNVKHSSILDIEHVRCSAEPCTSSRAGCVSESMRVCLLVVVQQMRNKDALYLAAISKHNNSFECCYAVWGGHDFGAIKLFISVYEQIMVEMVMENVVNVYLLMIIMLFGKWMAPMSTQVLLK